jgi:hypothetical protein
MTVFCECCVLSGKGLCDEPIPPPEKFYRKWRVVVCDPVTSRIRRPWPALGCCTRDRDRDLSNDSTVDQSFHNLFFFFVESLSIAGLFLTFWVVLSHEHRTRLLTVWLPF